MEQYIPKSALVTEIKRRKQVAFGWMEAAPNDAIEAEFELCDDILSFIDTLEVKEVNLEKHLKEDIEDLYFDLDGVAVKGATHYITVEDVKDIAKRFYELGLKAKVMEE